MKLAEGRCGRKVRKEGKADRLTCEGRSRQLMVCVGKARRAEGAYTSAIVAGEGMLVWKRLQGCWEESAGITGQELRPLRTCGQQTRAGLEIVFGHVPHLGAPHHTSSTLIAHRTRSTSLEEYSTFRMAPLRSNPPEIISSKMTVLLEYRKSDALTSRFRKNSGAQVAQSLHHEEQQGPAEACSHESNRRQSTAGTPLYYENNNNNASTAHVRVFDMDSGTVKSTATSDEEPNERTMKFLAKAQSVIDTADMRDPWTKLRKSWIESFHITSEFLFSIPVDNAEMVKSKAEMIQAKHHTLEAAPEAKHKIILRSQKESVGDQSDLERLDQVERDSMGCAQATLRQDQLRSAVYDLPAANVLATVSNERYLPSELHDEDSGKQEISKRPMTHTTSSPDEAHTFVESATAQHQASRDSFWRIDSRRPLTMHELR